MFSEILGKKLIFVVLWTIIIAFLSLMPNPEIQEISWTDGFQIDKLAHIFLYAMYTILLGRFLDGKAYKNIPSVLLLFVIPISYGILMEVLQNYLSPTRFFDMLDIIANIIGSIVGFFILKIKI